MVTTRAVLVANPRGSPPEQPGGDHSGCPPLSILSPAPLASQTRAPTLLSSTTRRLTPSLRPNSPSRAPSGMLGANSSSTAGGLSPPSGGAGSHNPVQTVTSRPIMPTEQLTYVQIAERLSGLRRSRARHRQAPSRAALAQQ